MKLQRLFYFSAGLILTCSPAWAQTTREEVLSDLNRTGGIYYAYPVTESHNTPAPKGYKPFYISHYGRHGSRYLISDNDYRRVADLLHKADKAGALTELGKDVMQRVDSLMIETDMRGGDLSPLGVRQHKAIADRMFKAYPEVFTGDKDISARSTLVVRCVLSMDAFCESLKEKNPKLNITRESSQRNMGYLCYHSDESNAWRDDKSNYKEEYRKFEESHTNPDRLVASIFSDKEFVTKNVNPHNFMWDMYWITSGMQDTETDISFYDVMTPEELFDLWQCFNYRFYASDGNYPGSNGLITANAKPLIRNIIASADLAIEDATEGKIKPENPIPSELAGNVQAEAATLRFGHDGNLIPLVAQMQIEGTDLQESDPEKFYTAFADWKIAPMAGNMQMIFFRDPKHPEKEVLVKVMLNEEEKALPIATDTFPFYPWSKVRAHLESRTR